jgi:hypothetical protein
MGEAEGKRRRLVEVFAEKSDKVADADALKRILIELDEQDARQHPSAHIVIMKFVVAGLSTASIAGSVLVPSATGSIILVAFGTIGWGAILYDTFGRRAVEFGASIARGLRTKDERSHGKAEP